MIRKIQLAMVFAVAAMLCAGSAARAEASLKVVNGMYVITLEGEPYDMGYQMGSLMKEEIKNIYKSYLYKKVIKEWTKQYAYLSGKGGAKANTDPRGVLLDAAMKNEPFIPDEFKEEMRGLADGAGLKYEDVLIMSTHIDYFAVLCSTFVARGAMTKDGAIIEGRNLDWASGGLVDLDPFSAVIVRKPAKGHAFASVIYPGIIGDLTVINDAGVSVEINFSMALSGENGDSGMPAMILMRQLAQYAGSLDEAIDIVKNNKRIAGYNITVVDGKKRDGAVIELTSKTVDTVRFKDDHFISTNHFMSPSLEGKNVKASNFSSGPSPERYARLTELMAQHGGAIDPMLARTIMHDPGVQVAGTVQTVILRPETMDFWVWSRNRPADDFVPFNLNDLLSGAASSRQPSKSVK